MVYVDLKVTRPCYYLCSLKYDNKFENYLSNLNHISNRIDKDIFLLSYNYIFRLEGYFILGFLVPLSDDDMVEIFENFNELFMVDFPVDSSVAESFYKGLMRVRTYFKPGNKVLCPNILRDYFAIINRVYSDSLLLDYFFPIRKEPFQATVNFQDVVTPLSALEILGQSGFKD